MNDSGKYLMPLIDDIFDGKCTLTETKKRIKQLEEKFGNNVLLSYDLDEDEKKEKKYWNKEYLEELRFQCACGMTRSKPFILHLAEVSEYVHSTKKRKKLLIGILSAIAAAAIVSVLFYILKGK